jgi:hypothetical protein
MKRFCSPQCAGSWIAARRRRGKEVSCAGCGARKWLAPFHLRKMTKTGYRCKACGRQPAAPKLCENCGEPRGDKAKRHCGGCARAANARRWAQIEKGTLRCVTLGELRRITGHSASGLRPADAQRRLPNAWDGKYVDLDHPEARHLLEVPKRTHTPDPLEEKACDCGCGRSMRIRRARLKQSKSGLHFATRECFARSKNKSFLKQCECGCGRGFNTTPNENGQRGPRRFFGPSCARRASLQKAPRYEVGDVGLTMRELVAYSGRSSAFIADGLRRGLTPLAAATRPAAKRGPKAQSARGEA